MFAGVLLSILSWQQRPNKKMPVIPNHQKKHYPNTVLRLRNASLFPTPQKNAKKNIPLKSSTSGAQAMGQLFGLVKLSLWRERLGMSLGDGEE